MSDENPTDDQGSTEPVMPTDGPTDERDAKIAALEAELAAANDHIADLESMPIGDDAAGGFGGTRTPALDAFEENQWRGEVAAWERETGLSYAEPEPTVSHVDEAIQHQADEVKL